METAISFVDAAIGDLHKPLEAFSELGLMRRRVLVEGEYFIALSALAETGLRELSPDEVNLIRHLENVTLKDAEFIKNIELNDHGIKEINNGKKTNHDLKAIEYFMRFRLKDTSLNDSLEWLHFALTSEDVNNIAHAIMLQRFVRDTYVPLLKNCGKNETLSALIEELSEFKLNAKLTGATGNFNAHVIAYPNVDWLEFSKEFVSSFGFKPNLFTTQIEPKDSHSELFQLFVQVNNYFSKNTDNNTAKKYFALSSALFRFFSHKLTKSRYQRDLSDSTVQRNYGVALAYSLLGINESHHNIKEQKTDISELTAISPLRGRYYSQLKPLEGENLDSVIEKIYSSDLSAIIKHLNDFAEEYADIPMLAKTHGQPATPTTLGKEYKYYAARLLREKKLLDSRTNKTNQFAYKTIARINDILQDLDTNFWLYISDDYLSQKHTQGQVGSSTMPHKINPIDFENSEGMGIANVYLNYYLDWDEQINWGDGICHSMLAIKSALNGLSKVTPNRMIMRQDLENHPEVIAEAIQTILRREGYKSAYETLMLATQGKTVSLQNMHEIVAGLEVSESVRAEILNITPQNYIGYASKLAKMKL